MNELLKLPTDNFITTFSVAQTLVFNAVEAYEPLWRLINVCQEHIDGKKPVDQTKLDEKGFSWVSNFNYGKARAKAEQVVAKSIAKINSSLTLSYCTFRQFDEEKDGKDDILQFLKSEEQRGMIASQIGYALSSTLAKENRLSGWLNEVEYPSSAFGFCAMIYSKFDWIPEPTHPLNIAFRPNTKPEKVEQWVTFKIVSADELYQRWVTAKNEEAISKETEGKKSKIASSGWNLVGLEDCLLKAFKGKLKGNQTPEQWAQVIPYYRENPSLVINNTEDVTIAKIFNKELNGTLTETYITYSRWTGEKRSDIHGDITQAETSHLLYQKNHGVYDQAMHISLIRDSGFTSKTGYIQDMRGLAKYSVEDSIRYNRLRNGMNNKMQFIGSPFFEQSSSQSRENFKPIVSQGFILLSSSHKMLDRQPNFDISSHIAVTRFEEGEYARDTEQFDASIEGRLTSRPGKNEVQQVSAEVEFANNAKNAIKFKDYTQCFFTVLRRMPKVTVKKTDPGYDGRKRFYDTIKKNLPQIVKTDADVNKIINAIDSFVLEPITASVETITIGLQMAETPFARNRLKRMLLVAKGFPIEEVNLAVPLIQDKYMSLQDTRIATMENDMFFTTNEVVLTPMDDHIAHLDVHVPKAQRVVQGFQNKQLTSQVAFKYLENILFHSYSHYEMLAQDPVLRVKAPEYLAQIQELSKAKDAIRSVAEREMQQQEQEAQQYQMSPKDQHEIQTKDQKMAADQQRKDYVTQSTTKRKDQQMQLTHQEQMTKIELEHERKQSEAQ